MAVKIKRNTGLVGTMGKFNVMVDKEKVGALKNEGILELEIPEEKAVLQLSQLGVKTNKMNVKDGDRLQVSATFWGTYYGTFVVIFLFMIAQKFVPSVIQYGIILLYLICAYGINGFMYKIIKIPKQAMIRSE